MGKAYIWEVRKQGQTKVQGQDLPSQLQNKEKGNINLNFSLGIDL